MNRSMDYFSVTKILGTDEFNAIRKSFPEKMSRREVAQFGRTVAKKCIAKLFLEGKTKEEISDMLGLSLRSVELLS